ncbi:MAG: hypothetical protein U0V87_15080 [Acidobacteriota bacterium]
MLVKPIFKSVAVLQQPPQGNVSIGCPAPPGDPCLSEPAPAISGSVLAEEVVIDATIPTGYPAKVIWAKVQDEDVVTGAVTDLYETKSKEAVTNKVGSSVKLRLPGLRVGRRHRVFVGFCQDIAGYPGLQGCNCWSSHLLVDTPSGFASLAPNGAPLVNTAQKVEDQFRGPATAKQSTPVEGDSGDGVGPNDVWEDGFDPPTPDDARIDTDMDSVVLSNALLRYKRQAKHTDGYAATRFWVTDTSSDASITNYNVELFARSTGSGMGSQFYAEKLVYKQIMVNDYPLLALLDETQINPLTGDIDRASLVENVDYILIGKTRALPGPGDPPATFLCPGYTAEKCSGSPPLDTGTNRSSNSVVMQIATRRDPALNKTVVTAAVGWGTCPASGSVYDCEFACCLEKKDANPDKLNTTGQWSFFGHHSAVKYHLEWWKVGDASTGLWP